MKICNDCGIPFDLIHVEFPDGSDGYLCKLCIDQHDCIKIDDTLYSEDNNQNFGEM